MLAARITLPHFSVLCCVSYFTLLSRQSCYRAQGPSGIGSPLFFSAMGRCKMKRQVTVLLALVASVGIGAAAQAQTKKAFTIAEVEVLDKAAYEALVKVTTPEI